MWGVQNSSPILFPGLLCFFLDTYCSWADEWFLLQLSCFHLQDLWSNVRLNLMIQGSRHSLICPLEEEHGRNSGLSSRCLRELPFVSDPCSWIPPPGWKSSASEHWVCYFFFFFNHTGCHLLCALKTSCLKNKLEQLTYSELDTNILKSNGISMLPWAECVKKWETENRGSWSRRDKRQQGDSEPRGTNSAPERERNTLLFLVFRKCELFCWSVMLTS